MCILSISSFNFALTAGWRYMQYFVPVDFIQQKPIHLLGTKRLYFLYLLYLPFLQNLMWWWWIFSRTMQLVILRRWKKILQRERNDFGQNQCQLSAKFIGSKDRWGPTSPPLTILPSTSPLALGSWLSKTYSVFYWYITLDHTAKKPRNHGGTSLLQKAGGHLILMVMFTLYPFSKITQCILFIRLEQKP